MPIGNGGIIGPANVPTITTASGVWSLREQQQAQGRGAWPLALTPDPYFEYTTLLLPGNGTNGQNNNAFLDSGTANSGSGFPITRNGNTTQGTFSPFSQTGWGNYFDGSGDYLTTADNASFDLGATDWTIELWAYFNSVSGEKGLISHFAAGTPNAGYTLRLSTSNSPSGLRLVCSGSSDIVLQAAWTPVVGTWYHIAAVRNSGTLYIYVNGQQIGSTSISITIGNPSALFAVGTAQTVASSDFNGYISNVRLVKGAAVYTGNFTPPTAPLTAITNTALLTCQSNRFIDNSTNNFTITVNGNTSVVAFSPFNPTLPWSSATNGGSGYFDGNGDYLTVPDSAAWNMGSGDFTAECWIYPTSFANEAMIMGQWSGDVGGTTLNWALLLSSGSTGYLRLITSSNGSSVLFDLSTSSTSFALTLNTWQHIAAVRSGNTFTIYVNGVSRATTTNASSLYDATNNFTVGAESNTPVQYFTGYIGSLRLVKGTAVYTSNFTPPTAPLTAITNTSLLLNFTNAGIYDATSKNDLETLDNTVNGVRISTAQSKFGGSSIYFDGTGTDYLWIQADQPIQRFGTAPFTIELWIRLAATGSARGLVAKGTSTTGWLVSLNSSNQVVFTYGTSTITSTGTISANVWTYIAVVREGTGANQTKIYIGGVNDGTGTVSTDFNQTSSMYMGADRTGGSLFSGYMQDVRITNGYARTVTTIPTTAFPTL